MDSFILKLGTPQQCEQYALNNEGRNPENAAMARRRAVELRAEQHGATGQAERECLQAVYAYERALWQQRGKPVRASRTWQMIKRRGILPSVEHIVTKSDESAGYTTLVQMGMQDMAFEAVVIRYPTLFSEKAQTMSRMRLSERTAGG